MKRLINYLFGSQTKETPIVESKVEKEVVEVKKDPIPDGFDANMARTMFESEHLEQENWEKKYKEEQVTKILNEIMEEIYKASKRGSREVHHWISCYGVYRSGVLEQLRRKGFKVEIGNSLDGYNLLTISWK